MSENCAWCSRSFEPRTASDPNYYWLPSAGLTICWDCSDKYETTAIQLHADKVQGRFNPKRNEVLTQSGSKLPILMGQAIHPLTRWGRQSSYAVDSYGKHWLAKINDNLVTLRPTRPL